MPDETLIEAENLGKKFCRSLKRSLWYGVKDIARDINPFTGNQEHHTGTKESGAHDDNPQPTTHNPQLRPDEFWALQDVSFELKRGECLGLIGHNGAGKSTLLKILNGLIRPDTGRLTVRGRVGALIELSAGFNPILSGRENIYNRGALLGFSRAEIDEKFDAIVDFAEIGEFLDMPVRNYSSGMQVRLGFAVSSQMEPDVLILDEVLAVGDVAFRLKCINAMGNLLQNSAVVFVSHSMPQIVRVSTSILALQRGRISFYGNDLGAGIGAYLQSGTHAQGPQAFGSGEVAITSAHLALNDAGARLGETLPLPHGSRPEFEIRLSVDIEVDAARIQFLLWNQEMMPVMDIVADDLEGHRIAMSRSKDITVRGSLPPLILRSGEYMMSIHVNSDDLRKNYCRLDHAFHVQIDAVSSSGAHVLGIGTWHDSIPSEDECLPTPT